ncbi:MAG: hypothetical protein NT062_31940 [Proteobacteria bacterium]|nr:hypothetical protein [Pseudomonadota bacterium]
MISAADVRAELRATAVLAYVDVPYRESGRELRTKFCPKCGERSTACVSISIATGAWVDHAHGCRGGVLDLLAGYAGITRFPDVVELGASIAGITTTADPDHERRIVERHRVDAERVARDAADRLAAGMRAAAVWSSLARRCNVGERYLAGRGIDPAELRGRGDVVRYRANGDPAVALRDLATGAIVGVQYRRIRGVGGDKMTSETGSQVAGSALYGKVTDIDPDGVDVAVIVEGLADTLAAHLQFPGCAVFGAPGAGQIEAIATAVAPRVVAARGWILLTVDDDATGIGHVGKAIVAACRAGLRLADADAGLEGRCMVRLVELGEHHDLADAHAAGWRWSWPKRRAS